MKMKRMHISTGLLCSVLFSALLLLPAGLLTSGLLTTELQAQAFDPGDPMRTYLRLLSADSAEETVPDFSWLNGTAGIGHLPAWSGDGGHTVRRHPWQRHGSMQSRSLHHGSLHHGSWHPASSQQTSGSGHGPDYATGNGNDDLRVILFSPRIFASWNPELPAGGNDGALWQGVGTNIAVSAGVRVRYRAFTLDVRPVYVYSENRPFELSTIDPGQFLPDDTPISEFARPLVRADYPQRFGEESIRRLDPGLSALTYARESWKTGVSYEPVRTGPALYNPLLLSDNAPGFLHFFAATNRPLRTGWGPVHLRYFWGRLEPSDFYLDELNARRYITGLSVSFMPAFAPGLEIGLNRVAYGDASDGLAGPAVLFRALQPNPKEPAENESPDGDFLAKFSFSARWALHGTGFETYLEWGRNDYRRGLRDLFLEPELNRGYVIGFLKRFDLSDNHWLVFNGEMTQLENSAISTLRRPRRVWYEDDFIPGGFTHRGQILGAAIGPGSSAQTFTLSWYHPYGLLGASVGRVVHNNDRLFNFRDYYEELQGDWRWNVLRKLHQVEMRLSARTLVFLPYGAELQVEVTENRIENLYNVINSDNFSVRVEFALRVRMPGWL